MSKIKAKQSEVQKIQDELQVTEENWKRALADYQNLEKRTEVQRHQYIKLANLGVIEKLLSILDDLEMASLHLKNEGIDLVVNKLQDLLRSESVEEIVAKGKEFDPSTMECVEIVKGKANHVITVQQKGYKIEDRVIRPAKVEVGSK